MAANIKGCESIIPGAAIDVKIANTVHTVILVIQIAIPVLLVIFGMIDLFKAVIASKEEEIKKGRQTFLKRLLVAVIVFFVIAIVKFIISFVADDEEEPDIMTCAECFLTGDCTYLPDSNGDCPDGTKLNKGKTQCIEVKK